MNGKRMQLIEELDTGRFYLVEICGMQMIRHELTRQQYLKARSKVRNRDRLEVLLDVTNRYTLISNEVSRTHRTDLTQT